tara:strand:- start:662 stop:871 length:210 start_codon:yes stop_codon:yes gene_type:complete
MKKILLALCAPFLGLATTHGLLSIVLSFVTSNLIDQFWLGKNMWTLPTGLYFLFYYLIVFLKFRKNLET